MNWFIKISQRMQTPAIVNTPAFRGWFGGSKVVDQQGNPLIVYKGMLPYDYTKEDKTTNYPGPEIEEIQRTTPFPTFDSYDQRPVQLAGFFTDDPKIAQMFMFSEKTAMYPVFLKIERPAIFDAKGQPSGKVQFGPEGKPFRDAIHSGKYDGVFIRNTQDEANVYIPLKANQIKSALSNGTFNPQDNRLHI